MRMRKIPLEEALARCLDEIRAGADIEQVLARYPADAAALRPLLELALQLQGTNIPPPRPEAFRRGRARVMAAAQRMQPARSAWHPGHRWVSALLAAGLMLALLLGGGTLGMHAAEASMPGDPLYPLKLLKESAELAWAERQGNPLPVVIRQLERRSEEIETVQRQGRPIHPAVLQQSTRLLIRLLALAQQRPDSPAARERALRAVETHQRLLLALRDRVPPAARPALERALERANRAREVLSQRPPPGRPGRGPGRTPPAPRRSPPPEIPFPPEIPLPDGGIPPIRPGGRETGLQWPPKRGDEDAGERPPWSSPSSWGLERGGWGISGRIWSRSGSRWGLDY